MFRTKKKCLERIKKWQETHPRYFARGFQKIPHWAPHRCVKITSSEQTTEKFERSVSFVSSFGSFTGDVIWGSPSSSDCAIWSLFSDINVFRHSLLIHSKSITSSWRGSWSADRAGISDDEFWWRIFNALSLVGSWRGRIFRSLMRSSLTIGRNYLLNVCTSVTSTLILVESIKVRLNHFWTAAASRSVLYPIKPKRQEVPSALEELWTSVGVPPGPFFLFKMFP